MTSAEIDRAMQALRKAVQDPNGALDQLAARGADPTQARELLALLHTLLANAAADTPKFVGRPILAILGIPWIALRAYGLFDEDDKADEGVLDRLGCRKLTGAPQGAWLAMTHDRAHLAVLTDWGNPMDQVELQQIPAGSVVLHGPAAPQSGRVTARARARTLQEALPGGAWQLAHLGQCPASGPVSAKAAHRHTVISYAVHAGRRLPTM